MVTNKVTADKGAIKCTAEVLVDMEWVGDQVEGPVWGQGMGGECILP